MLNNKQDEKVRNEWIEARKLYEDHRDDGEFPIREIMEMWGYRKDKTKRILDELQENNKVSSRRGVIDGKSVILYRLIKEEKPNPQTQSQSLPQEE